MIIETLSRKLQHRTEINISFYTRHLLLPIRIISIMCNERMNAFLSRKIDIVRIIDIRRVYDAVGERNSVYIKRKTF